MFPVRRGLREERAERGMHVLQFKAGNLWVVEISPNRENWVDIDLHWCQEIKRRIPCIGSSCKCKGTGDGWALEQRVYCPVAYVKGMRSGSSAMLGVGIVPAFGIVGFTENCLDVLYEHKAKGTWVMERRGSKANGPIVATSALWSLPAYEWPNRLPVEATLMRLFGVRSS